MQEFWASPRSFERTPRTYRLQLVGERAAVVMSLLQSAKLNGHEPWAYLKDVLESLPMHPNHRIDELLPHRWTPID